MCNKFVPAYVIKKSKILIWSNLTFSWSIAQIIKIEDLRN